MRTVREQMDEYFAREVERFPTPPGLRSVVVREAARRAGEHRRPQWVPAIAAVVLAAALVVGLLVVGQLNRVHGTPARTLRTPDRKPGGRGKRTSTDRRTDERWISRPRSALGPCENVRPRNQATERTENSENSPPASFSGGRARPRPTNALRTGSPTQKPSVLPRLPPITRTRTAASGRTPPLFRCSASRMAGASPAPATTPATRPEYWKSESQNPRR